MTLVLLVDRSPTTRKRELLFATCNTSVLSQLISIARCTICQVLSKPNTVVSSTMSRQWEELVADKRRRQQESIPNEWRIAIPREEVLNVTSYPEELTLLTPLEKEITNTGVVELLSNLATSKWSSVQVTTAFSKRAIIAHQLVSPPCDINPRIPRVPLSTEDHIDELSHRNIC